VKIKSAQSRNASSALGLITTLGIGFGDIGTSPLYLMKAILSDSHGQINVDFILGAIS
jgi:KUP system potassium uptake protein